MWTHLCSGVSNPDSVVDTFASHDHTIARTTQAANDEIDPQSTATGRVHKEESNSSTKGGGGGDGGVVCGLRWESLQFMYPAASKRVLGSIAVPETSVLLSPSTPANHTIFNCTWYGADGTVLRSWILPPTVDSATALMVQTVLSNQ